MSAQCIDFTKPVARKEHWCSLCARTIDVGETYARNRMVGDDGHYVWKQCLHCNALMALYGNEFVWDWHEGYCDECVREWEPVTDESRLVRQRWMDRWRDSTGALYPVPTRPTEATS